MHDLAEDTLFWGSWSWVPLVAVGALALAGGVAGMIVSSLAGVAWEEGLSRGVITGFLVGLGVGLWVLLGLGARLLLEFM